MYVWRSVNSGSTWISYIIRSDGAKWIDDDRDDAVTTTWLSVTATDVQITNPTGSAVWYDHLVVLPFKVLDTWPLQINNASATPYQATPFVALEGDWVNEQATRICLGAVTDSKVKVAGVGNRSKLEVEFKAR